MTIYNYLGGQPALFSGITIPGVVSPPDPFALSGGATPFQNPNLTLAQINPSLASIQNTIDQVLFAPAVYTAPGSSPVGLPIGGADIVSASLEDLARNPVYQEYSVSNLLSGLNWQAIYQMLDTPPQHTAANSVQPTSGTAANSARQTVQQMPAQSSSVPISASGEKAIDQWDAYIQASAQRNGLDPNLVKAVIYQESRGNPKAQSGKNARGLMQLIPGTFASFKKHLSDLFGAERAENAFDPEVNIEAGCTYLAQMKAKFGSDKLALAAYNAGPGNVQKYGGVPPFSETQKYVATISERYQSESQNGSNEA